MRLEIHLGFEHYEFFVHAFLISAEEVVLTEMLLK